MKDGQDQQKKVGHALKNQPGSNNDPSSQYADPGAYSNVDNWKFSAKQTALLASLPKKIFTKAELVSFLNDMYSQLSKKIQPGIASSVQSIAAKYNNDGIKMGDAAVTGWYTNYREEALLLIIKAAANSPNDGLLLNNCAALLNMSGIEQKAIPLLKYVLQSYPTNSMLLNNLGQAYAGLGETDTAMLYLGRAIKIEPENSEANNTAGQIEAAKGNKQKAIEYFEQSLKVAYCKPAELKLSKIKKDFKLVPLVRPRVKIPEYFNLFKYDLPAQCTSTDNAAVAVAEDNAFRNMISKQMQAFGSKIAEVSQHHLQESMRIMNANGVGRKLKKDEFIAQPFYGLCQIMARDILKDFQTDAADLEGRVLKNYSSEMAVLENEYQNKLKIINAGFAKRSENCGEGKANTDCPTSEEICTAHNKLANQYLPKFAALTLDYQEKSKLLYQQYFDELVYWHYLSLHPVNADEFTLQYYAFIEYYLRMLGAVCQTRIIEPCEFTKTTAVKDSNAIAEMDCPLEIEIPFVVGKFELDCEKFSFKAGEGAIFGYEKNFKTKQSTVSVGIGVKLELEAKVGPIKAGGSVSAGETIFITFDGNNGFSDGGLKVDAKASSGFEAEAGKSLKGKKDILKEETGVGVKFGINSGCNFNEGPFKGKIGPAPEVPLNKNVNIYKPKEG